MANDVEINKIHGNAGRLGNVMRRISLKVRIFYFQLVKIFSELTLFI